MSLATEMTFGLRALINAMGYTVTLRKVTTLTGPNPAPNPPTYDELVVDQAHSAGVSVIDMRGDPITGRLIAGDKFTIAGDSTVYTVTGSGSISPTTTDTFPNVPFTPALAANAANGAAVTLTVFAADSTLRAVVTDPPARLIIGGLATTKDRQVRILDADLPTGVKPEEGDTIILLAGTDPAKIAAPNPMQMQGQIFGWSFLAKS